MAKKTYSNQERRRIATIFFTIFDRLSLEEMRALMGNRLAKSTINRDRKGLRERDAPSQKSAEAYAAALGYGDTLDPETPDFMRQVVDQAIAARRRFFNEQPLVRSFTSAHHPYPKRAMARLFRAIEERRWESVIDIIETLREGDDTGRFTSVSPYLDFYLGLAARNLGDTADALIHFRAAYEAVREGTNEERDFLAHAAINYALALQDSSGAPPEPRELDNLLRIAVACMPDAYPDLLVNVLVAATRMPEDYLGVSAERIAAKLSSIKNVEEMKRIRAIFLAQKELKELHEDDMFLHVIAALDAQIKEA